MAKTMNILAALALLSATAALGASALAQDKGVKALREAPVNQSDLAPDLYKQSTPADGFGRSYRQQPPLIPHKIDGYTHYVDRQGARLDKVAGTRYFCTQCHVPQADAKPLVGNSFENATQVK